MARNGPADEGVTSPLGTALTIGIVILMAVGLTFMVRIFMDQGDDPQELATFEVNEAADTIRVQHAESENYRGEFEIQVDVAGDFDDGPLSAGDHALVPGLFTPLGGAVGGPSESQMVAGTEFHFCADSGPAQDVSVSIRHADSNTMIWRGSFLTLGVCPA